MILNNKKTIYGDVWFNLLSGECIGIVTINNGYQDKAYIGLAKSGDKELDIKIILEQGTPFPFEEAIFMTGGKY